MFSLDITRGKEKLDVNTDGIEKLLTKNESFHV